MPFVHIQTTTRTDTQYKLQEAEFFLDHLRQSHGKFNFYLSAYVGAALFVTDVMKREYTRRPREFDDWFRKTKAARKRIRLCSLSRRTCDRSRYMKAV